MVSASTPWATLGQCHHSGRAPNLDRLKALYPPTPLGASGMDVGLPDGQMGNSEVGHLNLGAGRIVYQELTRITKDILDGDFFKKEALIWAMDEAKAQGRSLHLIGLLSDGGVHSHNTHLYALLGMAGPWADRSVHALLDGRDTPPSSGINFVRELETQMAVSAPARSPRWRAASTPWTATTSGRRVKMGMTRRSRSARRARHGPAQQSSQSYAGEVTDEFVAPRWCKNDP